MWIITTSLSPKMCSICFATQYLIMFFFLLNKQQIYEFKLSENHTYNSVYDICLLQKEYEKSKTLKEMEEKLISSAFHNLVSKHCVGTFLQFVTCSLKIK